MAKTHHSLKLKWFACAAIAALCSAACSAQPLAAASKPRQSNAQPASPATSGETLKPGEYLTEKGWGRLLLNKQNGTLMFSLESTSGGDMCLLDGAIQGDHGIVKDDAGVPSCSVKFTANAQGIEVTAATPTECKAFCGYNAGFEAPYLRVAEGCGQDDLDRTRSAFQRLYDAKNYKAALSTLSPVLARCLPTLEWEEEGAIRNDLAIAQYKNGLYAQCLATLDKYAEDAGKDDDAVVEGWTPTLADRYLAIVRAARTNIGLCRKGAMKK
ncbi:hypothetical protein HEP74_03724 [Xanthomonas sp. SS]|uniref:hypothetical protein n=1 Tax=Xanthomonas sp. SS TaxID=2724122 RepID=UPI00186059FC|nr:hypothetical protein [Xanthomonas sp. SS]QNH18552.1 hypothetical protein HEP74_03724 [Xanthomonas sp. SS]